MRSNLVRKPKSERAKTSAWIKALADRAMKAEMREWSTRYDPDEIARMERLAKKGYTKKEILETIWHKRKAEREYARRHREGETESGRGFSGVLILSDNDVDRIIQTALTYCVIAYERAWDLADRNHDGTKLGVWGGGPQVYETYGDQVEGHAKEFYNHLIDAVNKNTPYVVAYRIENKAKLFRNQQQKAIYAPYAEIYNDGYYSAMNILYTAITGERLGNTKFRLPEYMADIEDYAEELAQ